MNFDKRAAALGLILATAGCVTIGRQFPTGHIADIKIGKTTQAEISAAYGKPYRTGIEDGDATWTYLRYHFTALGGQTTDDLYVRFNADGSVKSYAFNTNAPSPAAK
ncbi:MAG TPA: outer membrane protein assembly factor BamE [Elusimicrobiota bacterium]|jgi:outer membrane protein assembly factor BamE (lipoprotein component of BamABCDE complex)|nr:outer membrane protein assembly factor BamE [Elusimicrobiota bacterium]